MKPNRKPSRFWRLCRIYFRRVRISVWLAILTFLGSWIYLNQVGLPGIIKKPLLEKLRAQGLDLQFSRLRLRWYEGIVADNVHFGQADEPFSPHLSSAEVGLVLDFKALTRLRLQINSLALRKGRLIWPLSETNGQTRQLTLDDIQTRLRFLPDDQWLLDDFTAAFAGARIQLSGMVTNASAARQWRFLSAQQPLPPGALHNRLRQVADALEKTRFSAPPELHLDLRGDARDLQSFTIRLRITAPGSETPWGSVSQGRLTARFLPADKNEPVRAELTLKAGGGSTPWAAATNLALSLHLAIVEKQTNIVKGEMVLSADTIDTRWGNATNADITAAWTHSLTNPVPLSGHAELRCEQAQTALAGGAIVRRFELAASLSGAREAPQTEPSRAWGTSLEPYLLDWECCLTEFQSPKLRAEAIAGGGSWRAPELAITNLHAELYQAQLNGSAALDVATRELHARITSDVDPHRFLPLLSEAAQRRLSELTWDSPPRVKVDAALVLPAWTNSQPDWRAQVQPSLRLDGEFQLPRGAAYRGVSASAAQSHFSYSNNILRLPDLMLTRPEGRLNAVYQANERTKEFSCDFRSMINPTALRPLLDTNQQSSLDLFVLTEPPDLSGEIRGRLDDLERVEFKGRASLTNFTFRGASVSAFQTAVQYSNQFLLLTDAQLQRGTQHISADSLRVDIRAQLLYLTNGFSTAEPQVVTRAIGPIVAQAVEPYRFVRPPTARVHGIIPLHDETKADLHFELDGGPFQWWKFNLERVAGHVHWKGEHLTLEHIRAEFYGGSAAGFAAFDFRPKAGADFQFDFTVTNALLQSLMADVSTITNRLEGLLSGRLIVNEANTADWRTCQGGGELVLKDGLIWEIPIFGIFSPVLNSMAPGLGSSRATSATGDFRISNGVLHSDDLEIRAPTMRLAYRGTVDLEAKVNARVDAELLRDVWLLGPFFSTILWPVTKVFEYKMTGSLAQPKTEPVFLIPKLMLMPFRPFRSPESPGPVRTNAPPSVP